MSCAFKILTRARLFTCRCKNTSSAVYDVQCNFTKILLRLADRFPSQCNFNKNAFIDRVVKLKLSQKSTIFRLCRSNMDDCTPKLPHDKCLYTHYSFIYIIVTFGTLPCEINMVFLFTSLTIFDINIHNGTKAAS